MFEGGISFNHDSDKALRYIGLLGTPIFAGYNLLVFFGWAHSSNYTGNFVCLLISGLWVVMGMYHFFARIRSRFDVFWRVGIYHALSLATVLFVTGFSEPFASSLTLLFLAWNIYFGRKALLLSMLSVIIAGAADAIVRYPSNHQIIVNDVLGVMGILILGIAMVGVIIAQETRRQALIRSQSQGRLQYDRILTIINNLTDATFSTDEKGTILMYNAASLELLDTNDNLHSKGIDSYLKLTDTDSKSVKLSGLLSKAERATRREDLSHTYSDGEKIRLEITYAPIRGGYSLRNKSPKHGGYIIIMRDITKAKSLEEERDEFISVVSHELRTPITIMEGSLSNLQLMIEKGVSNATTNAESINVAHDQALYLAKMVNDLSTLSRAERGVADAGEDIDVAEMLHKLYGEYQKDAKARKLHLNLELGTGLGTIHVSRLYVEELLQNFITNAIKYTKTGTVTILAKNQKDIVTFTVKDTGIGISRSDQAKIFNKFYRSEDYRIRETSGTGLGLYVSTKLAHKLGAKVNLVSRLNHGSSFSFSLPTKK